MEESSLVRIWWRPNCKFTNGRGPSKETLCIPGLLFLLENIFHKWYETDNAPGLSLDDRNIRRLRLRYWLLRQDVEFSSCPSPGGYWKGIPILLYENNTNHPMSSNSQPSATANKAMHSLKIGGLQNQREHHIILTKYEAVLPTAVSDNSS